jgi:hypothetical protein
MIACLSYAPRDCAAQPRASAIAPLTPARSRAPGSHAGVVPSAVTRRGVSDMGTKTVEKKVASGSEIFVPLNKL